MDRLSGGGSSEDDSRDNAGGAQAREDSDSEDDEEDELGEDLAADQLAGKRRYHRLDHVGAGCCDQH